MGAAFKCELCGEERRVEACHGELIDAAVREGRASCEIVRGAKYGHPSNQLGTSRLKDGGERPSEEEPKDPLTAATPLSAISANEGSTGYSPQAIQFYRTSGKYLRPKKYKGDPSEVALLSWKRGGSRGISRHMGYPRKTRRWELAWTC